MTRKKLYKYLQALRYIFPTLYFNFHYLPFRQAVRLPIILYKPHLLKCKGKIRIELDNNRIRYGMIQLGFRQVFVYPNTGFTWENQGGTVIFHGNCSIGNDSYFSIGPETTVDFGKNFCATTSFKLVSFYGIKFGNYISFGWECLCMDTNFHPLYDIKKNELRSASGPIEIGDFNWFSTGCKIMHSVITPEHCIFGMGTLVTRNCVKKSCCVMGGSPVRVLRENVVRKDFWHSTP